MLLHPATGIYAQEMAGPEADGEPGGETEEVWDMGGTNVLTLALALEIAERGNRQFQALRAERQVSQGRFVELRASALPQLRLRSQYVRLDDVPSLATENGSVSLGQLDNYEVALELSQYVYAGGGLGAALDLGRANREATESDIEHSRCELAYMVHGMFNGVLLWKENVSVAVAAERLAEENLEDVIAHFDQGMATRFDVLRAEEQVSSQGAYRIEAESELTKARLSLLQALGLPLDDECVIEGELRYEAVTVELSNSVVRALMNRNDLRSAGHAVEAQTEAVTIEKSRGRPSVRVFGEARYGNPDRAFEDEWETSWQVGVRLELPLFDGFLVDGRVDQAEARLRQTELMQRDLASRIELELAQAVADLESAEDLVAAAEDSVAKAEEAVRLAERGYEEGVQEQVDVLGAQLALRDSRRRYAQSVFTHVMAKRRLEYVMGELSTDAWGDRE